MALHYNIDSALNVTAIDAQFDAELRNIQAANIDMAFFGVGNWLSGNYVQNGTTINDIRSNLEISNSGLNASHFFIAPATDGHPNPLPPGNWTAYGEATTSTGLPYGSGAILELQTSNATSNITWNNDIVGDTNFVLDELIPATDTSKTGADLIDGAVLQQDGTSPGTALFQSVAVALFNKVGKNAAVSNDSDLVNDLATKFYSAVNTEMAEVNESYTGSKIFGLYLDQGRYKNDLDAEADLASNQANSNGATPVSTVINYVLNNTYVNMVVQLSGEVADSSNDPTLDSVKIISIFGNYEDTSSYPTKVDHSDNSYSMNIFLSLKHDERF